MRLGRLPPGERLLRQRRAHREHHGEAHAAAQVARGVGIPAVELGVFLHDGQPHAACARILEQRLQLRIRHADARIRDGQPDLALVLLQSHHHAPAGGRELHGVGQQVHQYARIALRIEGRHHRVGRTHADQRQSPRARIGLRQPAKAGRDRRHVPHRQIRPRLVRRAPPGLHQLIQQAHQLRAALHQQIHIPPRLGIVLAQDAFEHFRTAGHHLCGHAQVMNRTNFFRSHRFISPLTMR